MIKISVITVCYNNETTIETTIQSVISQAYENLEYIVIDGKSTDNSLKIADRYRNKITKLVSEEDNGIYDAINKGIKLATGEIIAILHADDFYAHQQVLSRVAALFEKQNSDTLYGDLQYVNRDHTQKVIRNWKAGYYSPALFLKGWMPPHPSFFVSKKCYDKYGTYNTDLKSSADYELMLRLLYKHKCTTAYLPEVLVKMRMGGQSNKSIFNRLQANKEDRKAWEINGLTPGVFTFIRKPLSKLKQFL